MGRPRRVPGGRAVERAVDRRPRGRDRARGGDVLPPGGEWSSWIELDPGERERGMTASRVASVEAIPLVTGAGADRSRRRERDGARPRRRRGRSRRGGRSGRTGARRARARRDGRPVRVEPRACAPSSSAWTRSSWRPITRACCARRSTTAGAAWACMRSARSTSRSTTWRESSSGGRRTSCSAAHVAAETSPTRRSGPAAPTGARSAR